MFSSPKTVQDTTHVVGSNRPYYVGPRQFNKNIYQDFPLAKMEGIDETHSANGVQQLIVSAIQPNALESSP